MLAACQSTTAVASPDPANATFTIERDSITLTAGRAEREAAPGSASKIVTTLAELRATGDVDSDGRSDTVVVLVHHPGGSGTFYYLSVLLNAESGAKATPALLLGDRIGIKTVRLDGPTVIVELLERQASQPLATSPSVAVTKRFAVQGGALVAR